MSCLALSRHTLVVRVSRSGVRQFRAKSHSQQQQQKQQHARAIYNSAKGVGRMQISGTHADKLTRMHDLSNLVSAYDLAARSLLTAAADFFTSRLDCLASREHENSSHILYSKGRILPTRSVEAFRTRKPTPFDRSTTGPTQSPGPQFASLLRARRRDGTAPAQARQCCGGAARGGAARAAAAAAAAAAVDPVTGRRQTKSPGNSSDQPGNACRSDNCRRTGCRGGHGRAV